MEWLPLNEDRIEDMIKLWNQELGLTFPIRERMVRQNVFQDINFLPEGSWLALDNQTGDVVGFVVAKVWKDQESGVDLGHEGGWIQVLLVDTKYRNRGIGGALLAKAEGALQAQGSKHISLGNDFYRRFFPGIPDSFTGAKAWFEKKGYHFEGLTHDMTEHYELRAAVELPAFQGVRFIIAKPEDRERIIAFIKRCFPGTWEYQIQQYWELGGTGREFVLMEKDGEIGGFCRINDSHSPLLAQNIYWAPLFQSELGGIGPLGIDEAFRGKRYGLAIVQAGIHYLVERGIQDIVIDTTPYVDFYNKLGYKVWKSYSLYSKQI